MEHGRCYSLIKNLYLLKKSKYTNMLEVISNQHLIKKERTGRMQKPRIPLHPTTKTRNIVFSSDGVSCAEKDEKFGKIKRKRIY